MSDQDGLGSLGAALEREHRDIDAGIDAFSQLSAGAGADPDGGPGPAAQTLARALSALRRHVYLEEEFLFPAMEAELAIPIRVMLREHGEIWRTLDSIQESLGAGDTPVTLASCRELAGALDRHNTKEESIFYTGADDALDAGQGERLQEFLAAGRMPAGWTPQALRTRALH